MASISSELKILLKFLLGYFVLHFLQTLVGFLFFQEYLGGGYVTGVDHYVVLRIFLMLKSILFAAFIFYLLAHYKHFSFWKAAVASYVVMLPILYLVGFVKYRCDHIYKHLHSNYTIYEGKLFEYDPMLGKRAVPNTKGYHNYWIKTGTDFRKSVIIDSLGFRVQEEQYELSDSSLLLYLGCSYTWGDGCTAEETYPYLVSKRLQAPYINAAQSAYGLGQMVILAERLIPEYLPEYVFVQYSPWLGYRASVPFQPTSFFAEIAYPYVIRQDNELKLVPPAFESGVMSVDYEHYRISPRSPVQRLRFYYDYTMKVIVHDLLLKYRFYRKQRKDKTLQPVYSNEVEEYCYDRIFSVAHEYDCKVFVVGIGSNAEDEMEIRDLFDDEKFINTDSVLSAAANGDNHTYARKFWHWALRDQDSIVADVHPNRLSHEMIAEEIYQAVTEDTVSGDQRTVIQE